ncbi:hypothetical protein BC939DRAFT_192345 [Gamsiella multidivaricata]|uniref:uncharacterized protein n=1 Tax=Gamsiella multidivaricata TaxID=101098 RepID=UPI0022208E48|nr:uncharacterized protein BC939DRAFT_192345 [Gamsiella multidivaricata]KAI7822157.1 hypothetical protein BC939DRAFT_192345 [Gamsiella multidivaricata]
MASLPTPPVCNARKHSYDFLSNSDAFLLGGICTTKRRRMLSDELMSETPASPPASNAGDDDVAELSDAESTAGYFMTQRRSLFQMRHVRHLTPTSPSLPEIVCFAPPTHEEYDYHPELDHSDDDEEEDEEERKAGVAENVVAEAVPSDLFVVEADQEMGHSAYLSEDNYSSSDDEADFGYHSGNQMQIDAMSSSDDSDSDISDVEDYQPVRRRGTWHGPSLEEIERASVKKVRGYGFACKLPRLDLTSYAHETVDQRIRPVLQHFCHGCQSQESTAGNIMVRCEGCPKAFHQKCHGETVISDDIALSDKPWFCDEACKENVKKRRVCVELPKKRLPLMSTPKPVITTASPAPLAAAGSAVETGRSRGMRTSIPGETSPARSK